MKTIRIAAQSEDDTERLATRLAGLLPERAAVALYGTLGAGKTRFVQALAAAAGVDRSVVVSPTYMLVHEYLGRVPIFHFDAYRLRDEDEFIELGVEEYFERPGWCLIEWADRVSGCLPPDLMEITIEITGPASRTFVMRLPDDMATKLATS